MKKILTLLMTLVMVVSCVVCLSVSSSAAELEWLEETYDMQTVISAFGTHEVNADGSLKGEALFGDGMWTYEYWDSNTGKFHPMQAYFAKKVDGWTYGGWWGCGNSGSEVYVPYKEAVNTVGDPGVYCLIGGKGKVLLASNTYGVVITYNVPADGVISFDAKLYIGSQYTGNVSTERNGGSTVYLYQNETRVWPATEEEALLYLDTTPKDNPKEVSLSAFNVKKGDKIRMTVFIKPGTTNGSKNVDVLQLPIVTWHSSTLPIGNPNGYPPENVVSKSVTHESCVATWEAAKNAAGYNVYLNGKKVNSDPITGLTYEFTGLEPRNMYEFTVTTVTTAGKESEPCEAQYFTTKKAPVVETPVSTEGPSQPITNTNDGTVTDSVTSDTNVDVNTDSNVPETENTENTETNTDKTSSKKTSSKKTSSKKTSSTSSSEEGFPWWIIIVIAGVVVLAIIAVVVFLVLKKKPAEDAAVEGEVAEGEAEAEEPAEGEAAEEVSEDAPEAPETPEAPTEE